MVSPRVLKQPDATSGPREITMKYARRDVFLLIEPVADLGDVFDAWPDAARQSGVASDESAEAVYLPGS
jgi:hypothetical protein